MMDGRNRRAAREQTMYSQMTPSEKPAYSQVSSSWVRPRGERHEQEAQLLNYAERRRRRGGEGGESQMPRCAAGRGGRIRSRLLSTESNEAGTV